MGSKKQQDEDCLPSQMDVLIDVLSHLADDICAVRKLKEIEIELLKSQREIVTKQDLERMEKRLADLIAKDAGISPPVEMAVMRLSNSLDRLDATIPDKKETNI